MDNDIDNEETPLLSKDAASETLCPLEQGRLTHGLVVGIAPALLCCGVIVLHYMEGWSLVTCLYVMSQIVTTVGYGDVTVTHSGTKIFMGVFVIVALVVLAYYMNWFITMMVEWQDEGLTRHLRRIEGDDDAKTDRKFGALNSLISSSAFFFVVFTCGMVFFRFSEHCGCGFGQQYVSGCDSTTFESCVISGGTVLDWTDSFYMTAITLTTVGFGDYHPHSERGMLVSIVWMVVGVGVTGRFLGAMIVFFFDTQHQSKLHANEFIRGVSRAQFNRIDTDGNGSLSRGEFLAYSLVKHMGVSADLIDEVYKEFDIITRNGNNEATFEFLKARLQELAAKRGITDSKVERKASGLTLQRSVSSLLAG